MSIEYVLARQTAQTSWREPRLAPGGKAELTAGDISLIASHAPHMSYHALMAKCCQYPISEREMLHWANMECWREWRTNVAYREIPVKVDTLDRLAELAVLAWIDPRLPHGADIKNRAAFCRENPETFRKKFQELYGYLYGELGYLETVGREAVRRFMRRDDTNAET
jgi:hypothetical protein